MSGSLILWITLALSLFWSVGLYNRLMRMRARGLGALGSVQKHMHHYLELVLEQGLVIDATSDPVEEVVAKQAPARWAHLLADVQSLEQSLKEAVATPLTAESLARLGEDYATLQGTWRELHETPADLAGPVVPVAMQARWEAITLRVESARSGFNQILMKYNEALGQFPARLVVGMMGFKPGGLL